jgi:hypothetical protein
MKILRHAKGGGTSMIKDYETLMGILYDNYGIKN